jgi:hypothetical protein
MGSTAKNANNISAIAIDLTSQRYGRLMALSTEADQPPAVAKFMILPEFRVAKAVRLGECPPAKLPPSKKMKDFP